MKAIRVHEFGGPEVLKLEDVADLEPGKGQVVVEVRAVGVNPVEAYVRTGTYAMKPTLPYTPGNDAAGIVKSVGEGVSTVKPGNRVYTSGSLTGTYAEQTLSNESQVHLLPPNATFEQGAALGTPYATAYRALFQRGGGKKGEEVLIQGASGGVGTAAVQLAHAAGMLVNGTAGTARGMKLVTEQGANHAVNHASSGYLGELMQLTGGRGFDLIIEMLANKNLQNDLGLLAKKGRVVVVGNRGTIEINPRDTMTREADIRGMTLSAASEAELREIHAALGAGLTNGTLHPVIGTQIPLAEASRAQEEIMRHSGAMGKMVLTVA